MWPPEALEFLRELEDNNDSDWFRANRQRYDEQLRDPTRATAERLSGFGEPHYFRPYNNLRYRPGPPLKENIAVAFGWRSGGFYVHLSLDGLMVAAGMFRPARDQLERFRAAISDGRRAKGFERALNTAESAGMSLASPELKRAPRGYPQDHPRVDRLRLKRMTVSCRHQLGPWLHEPACDERIRTQFEASRPLVKWLADTVGPSELPARD